jgi:dihydroorotate dehydrogenase electron transfer subunit
MSDNSQPSIFQESARILDHQHLAGDQHLLRLHAPLAAKDARAGQFAHIQVHKLQPLRRPLSIMRASPDEGWLDILYKVVGEGTRLLSERKQGESLDILAPIGRGFTPGAGRPLLLGGGVGMPPMLMLAEQLRKQGLTASTTPMVMLASEVPFPFSARPSNLLVPGLPPDVIAAMPLLDDWGIPSRLASLQGYPGCYQGYITDLARSWLQAIDEDARSEVEIHACGPKPMLAAVTRLAHDFGLPAQVSLEEYMACGLGGCAGCVVPVQTASGLAMQRVCVDGPVFRAEEVFAQ